ncbi:glycerol-3-phosphate acyltransferase 3-like isoform X1 [Varroa jacobsoni]|uniref:Phospholipid/glycerol acyltransferase domain-containing protein n=1 Tax=Varroa destructor TaxID=109461 RepID=A0A7M7KDE6_VARDE|nr:glycerol-3-phosphate acyltransferase 3-like isoform X2 [Varroa destructor]XP_022706133.1 glycerol-3-phosphate acyltransferase 3-like isoform X1 [Varroa jacobsoni]
MLDVISFFNLLIYYICIGISWFCVSLVQWLVFIIFPTGWNPYTFYVWTAWTLGMCGIFNVSLGGRDMYVKLLYRLFAFGAVKVERHRVAKVIQRRSTCVRPDLSKLDTSRFNNASPAGGSAGQSSSQGPNVGKSQDPIHLSVGSQRRVNCTHEPDTEDEELLSPSKEMIEKDNMQVAPTQPLVTLERPVGKDFQLNDVFPLIKRGVEAIVDDDFTKRFAAEELASWNLLTRTNKNYQFISWRLTVVWALGCLIRYLLLFPIRVILTFQAVLILVIFGSFIGLLKDSRFTARFKRWLYSTVSLVVFRMMGRAISATITYHNLENQAKQGGICVANHTSPLDVCILCQNNVYAMVGQNQGGFLGLLQNYLSRMCNHIWFERGEDKDRLETAARMKKHVDNPNNLPILIFPEGTCVNNTSVMMFKKGSFEVDAPIYPCAIRYNPAFGDAFWDSSKHGYVMYLLRMMTSWAIVADVWFMEPMRKKPDETSMEYANRVRSIIANRGGMVELQWDGMLKRGTPKDEWKYYQRLHLGKQIGYVEDEKKPVELIQKEQEKRSEKIDHSALWTYTPKEEDVPAWLNVTKPPNPEELLKNGKVE